MRILLSLMVAVLWTWSAGAGAEGCTYDSKNIKKDGTYFLVPRPADVDILQVDAKEVFDSLVNQRGSSFTCQFSRIVGARDDVGLFHAGFQEWACVNTKTQVAWNPRGFQYMTRSGEPTKKAGFPNLAADDTDFVLLDNDGMSHWFSVGTWQPGVLDRSIQRSEAMRQGGEHSDRSRGAYRHRFEGNCSKSDQFVLYSVTELFYPQTVQNFGNPEPRMPTILVARESEGPYTLSTPIAPELPNF